MASVQSASSSTPSRSQSRNGLHPSNRPALDRMPSTLSDTPIATNSALNKVGSASSSLYQNCRNVLARLYRVPGFAERFLDRADPVGASGVGAAGAGAGLVDGNDGLGAVSSDPVSRSLHALRLGASLCFLFNALDLSNQLEVNSEAKMTNLKACQRGTAHFVMACKQHLNWQDHDLFAIHELYGQDTNGVVKVINTVTKILDRLELEGVLAPEAPSDPVKPSGPSDERSMVVKEILDSERKYVQDLEVLQNYQRQVAASGIITQDQIHNLFLNLNSLADFQRRFLIGVEANASLPPEQQHFGLLFITMEDNFSVYEPYCANLTAAQELAISENTALNQLKDVLDPISELSPLLIKPVQRICKYPLLLNTLIKNTPSTSSAYSELVEGHASIERVTAKVNETTRREDNRLSVVDLQRRVEDWKGHDITSFGDLLLRETFVVIKSDSEREYNVYLFERIILCCKEMGLSNKKSAKSNSILKRPASRRVANLQLKGRIFVNNVTTAHNVSRSGQYLLEVRWRGDVAEEAFTIKCRTEELLKQWQKMIMRAVEEAPNARRRTHHLSSSTRRSERGVNSPLSQFPGTPLSEIGPSSATSVYSYQSEYAANPSYAHANTAQPSYPPHSNGFDDEGDDLYDPSESGRSTPSAMSTVRRGPTTRSLPPGEREEARTLSRPRAQTEDSSSAVINQWRIQTPSDGVVPVPSIPRGVSNTSNGSDSHSLRSSASSRHLRGNQSQDWGSPVQGNATTSSISSAGHSRSGSPAPSHVRVSNPHDHEITPALGGLGRHTSPPTGRRAYPAQPPLRNRSQSSPNIYQVSPEPSVHGVGASGDWGNAYAGTPPAQAPGLPAIPPLTLPQKNIGTTSAGTLALMPSMSVADKRSSSSSNGTDRSSRASSQSAGHTQTAATSPATTLPSSARHSNGTTQNGLFGCDAAYPHGLGAVAVRVKVTYGEDTFVVVVLSTVSYRELLDKVIKKIRLCGDRSHVDRTSLRLRYQDEDGDRILITSEEDVLMAFEAVRSMGAGGTGPQSLALFASVDTHNS
ncbi:cell division control protein 24, partial [Phenoliferia sp. Uapishka_3]